MTGQTAVEYLTELRQQGEPVSDEDLAFAAFCDKHDYSPGDWTDAQYALAQHIDTIWHACIHAMQAREAQLPPGTDAQRADPVHSWIAATWARTSQLIETHGLAL